MLSNKTVTYIHPPSGHTLNTLKQNLSLTLRINKIILFTHCTHPSLFLSLLLPVQNLPY